MIFTDRTIMVKNGTSSINDTIVLYRGDREVEIRFSLNEGSPFKFGSGSSPNIIEKTEATYGQLVIKTPGTLPPIFSEIVPTIGGKIIFTITTEMIDEITEVGNYTFQIRLLDENMDSRATLPEVVNGIEIREPIASEDTTNKVGTATVGYALTTAGVPEDTFDSQGNYNKTTWATGDRITAAKLNKIEDGIDGVNIDINELKSKVWDIQNPFDISSISVTPNISQIGSTVSPKLTWNYTHSTVKRQTINNEAIENTLRTKTFTGVTTTTTYTLAATSNSDVKKSKSATITFANGVYYGKSTTSIYDSALISGLTKELSNSKNRTITVNAGAGEYIFYCIPSRLGACSFNVGGFDGGFSKVATVNFTNSDNYQENYDIYKSDNSNLGNTNVTIK